VVDLAFYPGGAPDLRLGEEFHHNGLGIRCAQIGRVPRGLAHAWDRERLSRETLALLERRGDDVRAHLVSDVVPFADGPALCTTSPRGAGRSSRPCWRADRVAAAASSAARA
jgi:hypothetical protein